MRHIIKERRRHPRFELPWAFLHYRREGIFHKKEFSVDRHPIINISHGGLRFLTMKPIKTNTKLTLKIFLPEEKVAPLILKGRVIWRNVSPTRSFKYQIGVAFSPFDGTKNRNNPASLKQLKHLEQLYADEKDTGPSWLLH